tara:strand:- start:111 stop:428 length:318 start_codon:yes stop_codon:yes gene_type:complete
MSTTTDPKVTDDSSTVSSTDLPNKNVQLSLNDLVSIKVIFDVVTRRGAFLASELKDVGEIYNRLDALIKSVVPKDVLEKQGLDGGAPGSTPPVDAPASADETTKP